jgi:glycosyltransferase involved in cell wall biosynthesis
MDEVFRSPLTTLTAHRMADRLNGFVFLSESISERCAPWVPAEKRFVIPNTIDEAILCTDDEVATRQERALDRPLQLLFVSHMMPEKGYLDVLGAVALLREHSIPVQAHFVGGWVTEAARIAFEQRLAVENLSGVVTHHGSISDRAWIKKMYLDADIFLLPSYHPTEAQPIVLLEAMNAGLPIITTRHGSLPDLIGENEAGRVVPTRNPEAIAKAVQDFMDEAAWRAVSQQARLRFLRHYSPDAVRQQWEALLAHSA